MSDPMRPSALTGSVPETGPRPARDAFTDAAPLARPANSRETLPWWLALAFAVPLIGCGEQVVGWPRADETRPFVTETTPQNDATGTPTTAPISVTFSEAMSPGSLTTTTFVVRNGATTIPGTVSYAGVTAIFSPTDGLAADATYEATVTTGATDLVGNALAEDYVWRFSTVSSADETRPRVSSTTPEDGATGVPLNVPPRRRSANEWTRVPSDRIPSP